MSPFSRKKVYGGEDLLLEPRRLGEEAGQVGFVGALQDTAGDIGKPFIVQNDEAR
jgi:hypothetical protein